MKLNLLLLLVASLIFSVTCYADCDCDRCGLYPPCFLVCVSGVKQCPDSCEAPHPQANGTWIVWGHVYGNGGCGWAYCDFSIELALLIYQGGMVEIHSVPPYFLFMGFGSGLSGSAANEYDCESVGGLSTAHDGTISWSPIWDSSICSTCTLGAVDIFTSKSPIYYAGLDCCPAVSRGEEAIVTISCPAASYVMPSFKVDGDKSLVLVKSDPANCGMGSGVTFTIQALRGRPPAKATVTVWVNFCDEDGDETSGSATIAIEPQCGKCCSGGTSGPCRREL